MLKYILLAVLLFVCYNIDMWLGLFASLGGVIYILYLITPVIYSLNGNKYINAGDNEMAMKMYEKAYKNGKNNPSIVLTYAILKLKDGQADEAIKIFNEIVLNPAYKLAVKNQAKQFRALAYHKTGQKEDALEDALEIFEKYKNTMSYGLLGYLMLVNDKPVDEVIDFCKEAYEYNSDDRDIVDNLVFAYIKNKEFEKAKEYVDIMLEKFPQFVEAHYHGAICYKNLGDIEKAKELVEKIKNCKRTFLTTVTEEEIEELKSQL